MGTGRRLRPNPQVNSSARIKCLVSCDRSAQIGVGHVAPHHTLAIEGVRHVSDNLLHHPPPARRFIVIQTGNGGGELFIKDRGMVLGTAVDADRPSVYAVNAGPNPLPAKGAQVENTVERGPSSRSSLMFPTEAAAC